MRRINIQASEGDLEVQDMDTGDALPVTGLALEADVKTGDVHCAVTLDPEHVNVDADLNAHVLSDDGS